MCSPDRRRRVSTDTRRTTRTCWCGICSSSHLKSFRACAAAPARAIEFTEEDRESMTKTWMGAVLIGSLSLISCGGDKPPETAKSEATAPAAAGGAAATPDEANGGTVTGKVSFAGEKPKMATLDMSANPACERAHKGSGQKSEEVVVNDNGTLKYGFVWVKSGLPTDKQWAVPTNQVSLDQNGCMYKPH